MKFTYFFEKLHIDTVTEYDKCIAMFQVINTLSLIPCMWIVQISSEYMSVDVHDQYPQNTNFRKIWQFLNNHTISLKMKWHWCIIHLKAVYLRSICRAMNNNFTCRVAQCGTRFEVRVQIKFFFVMSAKEIHNVPMLRLLELQLCPLMCMSTKHHRYPHKKF